jgi:hypothetical protein
MEKAIEKAADQFLNENGTSPQADHWSFRMGAKWAVENLPLDEIIKYIEETEKFIDGEWGSCRSVEKLIEHNCMPELYAKMLALKNGR